MSESSPKKSPRVLILSVSAGGGHMSAAKAVELALKETYPNAHVENRDLLDFARPPFRTFYAGGYLWLAHHAPWAWGMLYDATNKIPGGAGKMGDRLRLWMERFFLKRFLEWMQREPWDAVISTHFLPAELIAWMKREGILSVPQMTVITDYRPHRFWINEPCEHYFAATDEVSTELKNKWDVPAEKISITGIPIHPSFSRLESRENCITSLGLSGDKPVVFQLGGVFGIGPVESIYQHLMSVAAGMNLIVCAGRNETMKRKLESLPSPTRHTVKIIGYTERMSQLMVASDLIISKSGGLTIAESLATGVPVIVINPLPGQEFANARHVTEKDAGIWVRSPEMLGKEVSSLLQNREKIEMMKANARKISMPRAAFTIAEKTILIAGE